LLTSSAFVTCFHSIQRKYTPKAPLYDHTLLPSLALIRAFEGECLLVMANPGVGTTIELPGAGPASGSPAAALERWGRALVGRDNTYDRGFFGQSGVWAPLAGKMVDAGVDEGACEGVLSLEVIRVRPAFLPLAWWRRAGRC
jgi:hypothetical protein